MTNQTEAPLQSAVANAVPAMKAALAAIYPPQSAVERARGLAHLMQLLLADAQDWPKMWKDCLETVELHGDLMFCDVTEAEIEAAAVKAMRRYITAKGHGELFATTALLASGVPKELLGMATAEEAAAA